ncbi:hypothetical protein F5144DRAFT_323563 [Chaetomium tenue]|uniref:Uncharacterized protein n=1 Tax=Chaetomium tenue TaxID=1854479 RepID=A0ACB7P448_9PEZI|nr:hypothetical protein F5144DRAFT_323563 [Chaetomium globosum]
MLIAVSDLDPFPRGGRSHGCVMLSTPWRSDGPSFPLLSCVVSGRHRVNRHHRCRPDLGLRRMARPGLAAGLDVVGLLGAVAIAESVVAVDALDRGRLVSRPFAIATNPEDGADISGRLGPYLLVVRKQPVWRSNMNGLVSKETGS